MYKRIVIVYICGFIFLIASAQGYDEDKTSLANFVHRMYTAIPFEGVKVIEDYDHSYFISVVSLEKATYTNSSIMNRVAQVKAQRQLAVYLNGSNITSDLIITTDKKKENNKTSTIVQTIETIKEDAVGFSQGMELLINFIPQDTSQMVFVYCREIKE
jgi:hypothetical protein